MSILPLHADVMYSGRADEAYDWLRLEAPTIIRTRASVRVEPDDANRVVVLRMGSGRDEAVLRYEVSDASTDTEQIVRVVTDVSMPNARKGFLAQAFGNTQPADMAFGAYLAISELFEGKFKALPRG